MDKYVKLCMRCENSCKQRADLGLKLIKCPLFTPKKSTSRNNKLVEDLAGKRS